MGIDRLGNFFALIRKKPNESSFEIWFKKIAYTLMNELYFTVGEKRFRIIQCEFYYHDDISHSDPYVHKGEIQKTIGHLYYNKACGLDVTFGSDNVYAGILIRAIQDLDTNVRFLNLGDINREFFNGFGNLLESQSIVAFCSLDEAFNNELKNSRRKGLKPRAEDRGKIFYNKLYRFEVVN